LQKDELSATFPHELLKSGGGPPQSKTLARDTMIPEIREASWTAPAPWRSGALQADELSATFPHELLCANDNMNRYIFGF
jgi:hypothetical protein